ncbi:MAG: hypothetical protein ABIN94_04550 [Ferruginibacter sp.]
MKNILLVLLLLAANQLFSQSAIQGEYHFSRQEMVAGFNFLPAGKFEFYYSYGAVDRTATGTFTVKGDAIKLKSDKASGKDFTILSESVSGKGYTVKFEDPNNYLVNSILCIFLVNGKSQSAYSDDNGDVHIDVPDCDSIFVLHPLFPDIVTRIKDSKNRNNFFKLSLNPSLGQVSFKGIDFKIINKKTISCNSNYFMNIDGIKFIKN